MWQPKETTLYFLNSSEKRMAISFQVLIHILEITSIGDARAKTTIGITFIL